MKLAAITFSNQGALLASNLKTVLSNVDCFFHETVAESWKGKHFQSVIDLTHEIFEQYEGLIFIAPCGVAVRAIAGVLKHKTTDPAVIVIDVGGRFAVSLLSGHEGGANELAVSVANILGAEPVISTTTEALKTLIVGIGCRKGVSSEEIIKSVKSALKKVSADIEQVRLLATAEVKANEPGLLEAAKTMGIPLRIISSDEIRSTKKIFDSSAYVQEKVNLPAVAEPSTLLAGRRTKLILPKTKYKGITIAIARESCMWSESDREAL